MHVYDHVVRDVILLTRVMRLSVKLTNGAELAAAYEVWKEIKFEPFMFELQIN